MSEKSESYIEFHESKEDLYMPDDYQNYVECCSCGEYVPASEILTISHDNICIVCAPFAEIYRCGFCGKAFEKADKCPICGLKREEK